MGACSIVAKPYLQTSGLAVAELQMSAPVRSHLKRYTRAGSVSIKLLYTFFMSNNLTRKASLKFSKNSAKTKKNPEAKFFAI